MEGTQIFVCIATNSVKTIFKKDEGLFLKVEEGQVSGKAHICNADGENGYIGEFSFSVNDIRQVSKEKYKGTDSLLIVATKKGLYGKTTLKIFLPQLRDDEIAIKMINRQKKGDVAVEEKSAKKSTGEEKDKAPAETVEWVESTPAEQAASVQEQAAPVQEQVAPVQEQAAPVQEQAPSKAEKETKETVAQQNDSSVAEQKQIEATSAAIAEETADNKEEITEEEFQKRMDKLNVLKDCGLLAEKEFISKKLELVSLFYRLGDFNGRIQKLIALRDCGLLSDKEFEQNRQDVISECSDLDVDDIDQYRLNIQKLLFLEMGGLISTEECEKSMQTLIKDVSFRVYDSKETFVRKLKRLPILKECGLLDERDYENKVDSLFAMLEVAENDSREIMVGKLTKWPLLVQEKYISTSELKMKQNQLMSEYLNVSWKTPDDLKAVINKMITLKEGECLTDWEFQKRRELLLKDIDAVKEYTTRIAMYRLLPQVGFISDVEYEDLKQKCIDRIFVDSNSVEEFKVRANNLIELQKVGILSSEEFEKYKSKLMSEL